MNCLQGPTTNLFACHDFSLEPPADDLFAHVFDASDKQLLKFIFFYSLRDFLSLILGETSLEFFDLNFQLINLVSVVRF